MAIRALISRAESDLELEELDYDFGPVEDMVFEDLDHERLYTPELDGAETGKSAKALGYAFLEFDSWFRSFNSATSAVHPYAAEGE